MQLRYLFVRMTLTCVSSCVPTSANNDSYASTSTGRLVITLYGQLSRTRCPRDRLKNKQFSRAHYECASIDIIDDTDNALHANYAPRWTSRELAIRGITILKSQRHRGQHLCHEQKKNC